MKSRKLLLILFFLNHFIVEGQEELLVNIFETIKSDDPTEFYNLYILDEELHEQLFGHSTNYEVKLDEYQRDRYAVFYEIIRKVDDHTKIEVDSIKGINDKDFRLFPTVFFSTEKMSCSCQFTLAKIRKEGWVVTSLDPRSRCRKKKS